jgi:hypothetical protein
MKTIIEDLYSMSNVTFDSGILSCNVVDGESIKLSKSDTEYLFKEMKKYYDELELIDSRW